jgi:uncharacterized membrane protein YhaH (DUF805 family)
MAAIRLPETAPLFLRIIDWARRATIDDAVSYDGRLNRRGFAAGMLLWLIWATILVAMARLAGGTVSRGGDDGMLSLLHIFLTALLLLWPLHSLIVRRLHDIDRYGWAVCVVIMPYIGWLILGGMLLWKGNSDENAFGSPPGQLW